MSNAPKSASEQADFGGTQDLSLIPCAFVSDALGSFRMARERLRVALEPFRMAWVPRRMASERLTRALERLRMA